MINGILYPSGSEPTELEITRSPSKRSPQSKTSSAGLKGTAFGRQSYCKKAKSPIEYIGGTNCRLSFLSTSPTRYDEQASSTDAKSGSKLIKTTNF